MNTKQEPSLQSMQPPLSASMPNTQYYEVDSAKVGARLAVWVTTPPRYQLETDRSYPAIFMPDANVAISQTVGLKVMIHDVDPIYPILPFVQVSVGYTGDEAADQLRVRNRDLLPPGEPMDPMFYAMIDQAVASGAYSQEYGDQYKASLSNTRGDAFLAFLTEDLFPLIEAQYRIDRSTSGLFGYSYGGLFAIYAAFQRTEVFTRIGAGSPGMTTPDSVIFQMLQQQVKDEVDHSGRQLHMTVNALEITAPTYLQMVGANFTRFVTTQGATPLKGLQFTSSINPTESHASGMAASWCSFLRTCYSA